MSQWIEQGSTEEGRHDDAAALVARLCAHADEIRAQGIVSLAIFGSRACGDERPDSDLDVLVAYDPNRPFTLYDLVRVEHLLEELTGLDVHVSTRDGFRPHRLDRVLKDAVSVL
jgi:predicted nucleotidyltransferase